MSSVIIHALPQRRPRPVLVGCSPAKLVVWLWAPSRCMSSAIIQLIHDDTSYSSIMSLREFSGDDDDGQLMRALTLLSQMEDLSADHCRVLLQAVYHYIIISYIIYHISLYHY